MSDFAPGVAARPRIAVLIAAYNAEQTIGKVIQSLNANAEPHDIVIVDDGSRKSLHGCVPPQANLTILRLEKNVGVTAATNQGLKYILDRDYEFVARMDADDASQPDRLILQRAFMDEHPDVALLGSWGRVVSERGETLFYLNHPTDHETIVKKLYYNNCLLHPSCMMRASAFREVGLYDEFYPVALDYELMRRFASRYKIANLPHYLIDYTMSSGGISLTKRRQQLHARFRTQWDYRNFWTIHFYLGLLKTTLLWFMPVGFITALKRRVAGYHKQARDRTKSVSYASTSPRPRIAVLIPAYNAEHTIMKAIASLDANVEPHDIAIVDDGSRKPLRDFLPSRPDIVILRLDQNVGISHALNHGLKYIMEQGYEFIARLDADDVATPDRLVIQRAFMDEHQDIALAGGWGKVVSEQGKVLFHLNHPTDYKAIVKALNYNNCFLHPTFIIRTEILREIGLYSEDYPGAEDYELVRRVAGRARVANIPQYLVEYTLSSSGISLSRRRQQVRARFKIQWKYRNLGSVHFYLGVLKTFVVQILPVTVITAIKQIWPRYRER